MAKAKASKPDKLSRKPLLWLHGEIKSPPFTPEGRQGGKEISTIGQVRRNDGRDKTQSTRSRRMEGWRRC